MKVSDSNSLRLETRALRYLARREHSRYELEKKLSAHEQSAQVLSEVLDRLEQQGYLSTERFAEQTSRTRRSRFGSQRIVHELKEKGVDATHIARLLPDLMATDLETAWQVWQKKFGTPPRDIKERGRQMRFLTGRGFSPEIIRKVLLQAEKDAQ
ncbi:recombination regulator RecX [Nitrosomonas marina]|uniref:Regulatory protein RecX n=1 Tax=Nitrosomonas marina TaxID=917 RepID=A0A1H8BRJ9_9PROT|nr:recombination regulator RecX [Nitrosomonas marina]SEM84638.1 regulatory protein [Nitrosomonas marina]